MSVALVNLMRFAFVTRRLGVKPDRAQQCGQTGHDRGDQPHADGAGDERPCDQGGVAVHAADHSATRVRADARNREWRTPTVLTRH
jgi:hypothetical protein